MKFKSALTALSLEQLLQSAKEQLKESDGLQLVFICTHNARRSQLGQFWAAELADQYGLKVKAYSGGTTITQVHPNVVQHIKNLGFEINQGEADKHFVCKLSNGEHIQLFSKKTDDAQNPKSNFLAIMTCIAAEEACPFMPGAIARIALPYQDPGAFDENEDAMLAYEKCSEVIKQDIIRFYSALNEKA